MGLNFGPIHIKHQTFNIKLKKRRCLRGQRFFHFPSFKSSAQTFPMRVSRLRSSSRSSGVNSLKTMSFNYSMRFWTGSLMAMPAAVGLTRMLRRLLGSRMRSMRPRFCIRSRTPEMVEFSTRRMLAISFGVSVSSFQRQARTPYCPGVMPNSDKFSEKIKKTSCCEMVSKKLMHLV